LGLSEEAFAQAWPQSISSHQLLVKSLAAPASMNIQLQDANHIV
jgi:hypothetical protein